MTELWKTPGASSGFLEGVAFKVLPGRTSVLSFQFEAANGGWETCELLFRHVAAFKCTYLPALTAEMVQSAYDRLVEVGSSSWLSEAHTARQREPISLRHLRICFDDGPCYEFLCGGFEIASGRPPTGGSP
jgi:hypothetical protein